MALQNIDEKNWKCWGHDFKFTKYTLNTKWGFSRVIFNLKNVKNFSIKKAVCVTIAHGSIEAKNILEKVSLLEEEKKEWRKKESIYFRRKQKDWKMH